MLGDRQRQPQVLLDEDHGHALRGHLADHLAHLGHDRGREAVGGFVEEQQPRVAQQGPGYREHPLLPAGELVAAVAEAFPEPRQQVQDARPGPRSPDGECARHPVEVFEQCGQSFAGIASIMRGSIA
ncbi:hypothetical protein OG820_32655 [Streptomyces sp. NBC_00211]